jgi:hypothetical protein
MSHRHWKFCVTLRSALVGARHNSLLILTQVSDGCPATAKPSAPPHAIHQASPSDRTVNLIAETSEVSRNMTICTIFSASRDCSRKSFAFRQTSASTQRGNPVLPCWLLFFGCLPLPGHSLVSCANSCHCWVTEEARAGAVSRPNLIDQASALHII